MNIEETEIVQELRTGICQHTGKHYDCARCVWQTPKDPDLETGEVLHKKMHMSFCIEGYVEDNTPMREWNRLGRIFSPQCTGKEAKQYFYTLYALGVKEIPIGECDKFCYKHGCPGHIVKIEKVGK